MLPGIAVGEEPHPLAARGVLLDAPADWIAWDADVAVLGSGTEITIAATRPTFALRQRVVLDAPATDGAIAGSAVFLVQRFPDGERLAWIDLAALAAGTRPVPLDPPPRSALRLARMDDYLLVAEDGRGLRVLELPGHRHDASGHHQHAGSPAEIGFQPLDEPIHAVATSLRSIFVATAEGLAIVDATVPSAPVLLRRVRLADPSAVRGLAANGARLHVLTTEGLRRIELTAAGEVVDAGLDAGVRGTALVLAGRVVYVAAGAQGVRAFEDLAPAATTFFVQVGDIFFTPAGTINVNAGDIVQWQKPGTVFTHNVFSCRPGQIGCASTAVETFSSGTVTTAAFTFSHTFTIAGSNPYVCQSHSATMTGNVQVAAGAPPPPAIPDGTGGSIPVSVTKDDPGGVDLKVAFDAGCPGAVRHDILYGTRAQLPAAPGGTYGIAGALCDIGATSPFGWTASPDAVPGDFVWWVVLTDDGTGTEGSWGTDSGGNERDGAGTNGASAQCGNTDKDPSGICEP